MSWFQAVDGSWHNGEHVRHLKVRSNNQGLFFVTADGVDISNQYLTIKRAKTDLNEFVSVLMLNQRAPNFWLTRSQENPLEPDVPSPQVYDVPIRHTKVEF